MPSGRDLAFLQHVLLAPLTFSFLDALGVPHAFTLRQDRIPTDLDKAGAVLALHGFDFRHLVRAEQPHGNRCAVVSANERGQTIPGVDALVTADPTVTLLIRTADCGPLFFYDSKQRVVALAHSGRKGTEGNIVAVTLQMMREAFGTRPDQVIAVLGPTIRVPDYDVPFADQILRQLAEAGVRQIEDSGFNTAADLSRFYSYRKEKGQTGRHFAAIHLP
ncbi:MAG: peptidoglycan editing factor PgeF [Candidatus Methylacidiphilales bacterium]